MRQNQYVIKYQNDELEFKFYPKRTVNEKQIFVKKPEIDIQCALCENLNRIEFNEI